MSWLNRSRKTKGVVVEEQAKVTRGRISFAAKAFTAIDQAIERLGSVKAQGDQLKELSDILDLLEIAKTNMENVDVSRVA